MENDKGTNLNSHKTLLFLCYLFCGLVVILNQMGFEPSLGLKRAGFWPAVSRSSAVAENLCQEKSKLFSFKNPFSKGVSVFKRDGSRQCEEDTGTSAKEMAKALKLAGIRVLRSAKGRLPRGRSLALCGAPTQNINIFYISAKHEKKAIEKGFQSCKLKVQKPKKKQDF